MSAIDLSKPLPAEVLIAKPGKYVPYRNFAVFSWPWLKRRSIWLATWIAIIISVTGASMISDKPKLSDAFVLHLLIIAKIALICGAGPLVATVVRQHLTSSGADAKTEVRWTLTALFTSMLLAVLLVFAAVDMPRQELTYSIIAASPTQKPEVKALVDEKIRDYRTQTRYVDSGISLAIAFLLGGGLAAMSYRREHSRLKDLAHERQLAQVEAEKREIDTKLAVLQAQVEPHFLFNSLASVRALVKQDPDRAQQVIDALVAYLRATIPQMREERGATVVSTLDQQLKLAKAYLDVMAVRMGDRLNYSVEVPAGLQQAPFPPLLLISLVENAVKHGAEPKPGSTHIAVTAEQIADSVVVAVADTGGGMQAKATSGVDSATLTLKQNDSGGVTASIAIPLTQSS
jgi:signal transduction histidine kinase